MGKTIADLPALQAVSDETLIPVYQPGAADPAQKMKGKQFREFAEQAAEQYVDGATDAAGRAEAALAALGNDAAKAQQAATDAAKSQQKAAESEKKAELYANQTEASVSGVASFNGRGGHVMPQAGDYTAAMVGAAPAGFGLGTKTVNAPTSDLGNADANAITGTGFYSVIRNTGFDDYGWSCLIHIKSSSTDWIQFGWHPTRTNLGYKIRRCINGAIGAWKSLYDAPTSSMSVSSSGATGRFNVTADRTGFLHYKDAADSNTWDFIGVFSNNALKDAVKFYRKANGVENQYSILHTGNKPSGQYTGNGDATKRIIEIGGIGSAILVWSKRGFALLTYYGAFLSNGHTVTAAFSDAVYANSYGNIVLTTTNGILNENGVTYNYQFL